MSNSIVQYMSQDNILNNIEQTLKDKTPQFIVSVASLVASDNNLANCDRQTILSSCLISASIDLPINNNLGFAYIIPYKNKAQFQMGYKGFIQLAIRTSKYKSINSTDVREGEYIGKNRLTGDIEFNWIEDDIEREKLPIIGYLGYFELLNGFSKQLYMTNKDLKKHGLRFSQSFKKGYGLWSDDFDSMAKKTVLKLLLSKWGILSTQMQKAIELDQTTDGRYIDNQPVDAREAGEENERDRIIRYIEEVSTIKDLEECKEAIASQDDEVKSMYEAKEQLLKK